jgi:hypothetical protein
LSLVLIWCGCEAIGLLVVRNWFGHCSVKGLDVRKDLSKTVCNWFGYQLENRASWFGKGQNWFAIGLKFGPFGLALVLRL